MTSDSSATPSPNMSVLPLDGRVLVVTGGSSGIGLACACAFAAAGADVVIVGRDHARIDRALGRVSQQHGEARVLGLALDISEEADAGEAARRSLEAFGTVDILITAAGIGSAEGRRIPTAIAHTTLADWQSVLATNLTGVFLIIRAFLPLFLSRGSGHVISISSYPAGVAATPLAGPYCASKFAVTGLSSALAKEVGDLGVRVDVLFPGLTDTPMTAHGSLSRRFGPPLRPERVAELALFLATRPADVSLLADRVLRHPALIASRSADRPTTDGS